MKKLGLTSVRWIAFCLFCFSFAISAPTPQIEKMLLYDHHTLSDSYPYKKGTRQFQWNKISDYLALIESIQSPEATWGILQNNKNKNGIAPLVKNNYRDVFKETTDHFGIQRNQSVPLYSLTDIVAPERYAHDGELVKILGFENGFAKVETMAYIGEWLIPEQYVRVIYESITFNKVIFIDRTNQNITALEKMEPKWLIRSMNPATTGLHEPPYHMETPIGIFVVQEKKRKMYYYKDGTTKIAGYAPDATRFTSGTYIHGVPLVSPSTREIEFSSTLGTTPRSHKCVRNATSHAKFIYDWANIDETLVIVFD